MGVESLDPADLTSIRDLPQAEIYTVRQAAVALGVSTGQVYQLLRDGRIPAKRLGRR
jgi:excisionase family DNA binding protein